MKRNFLLLLIITAVLSSCSTSYRTGQTPDDVYYSPARLQTDEVKRDRDENNTTDNTVYTSSEDREIRRRIRHRRYRRYDDRYDYPYGYNGPVYGNPKYGTTQNTSEPRKTNLGVYKPNTTPDSVKYTNPKFGNTNTNGTTTAPVRTFGTPKRSSNNGSAVGNFIRDVFTSGNGYNNNSNNSNNSNTSSPNRTFDRSSNNNNNSNSNTRSTSSDTKTSSSSSAPVRTFGKQN